MWLSDASVGDNIAIVEDYGGYSNECGSADLAASGEDRVNRIR